MSAAGSLSPEDPPAREAISVCIREVYGAYTRIDGVDASVDRADAICALLGVPADVPTSTITRALAIAAAVAAEVEEVPPIGSSDRIAAKARGHNYLLRRLRKVAP